MLPDALIVDGVLDVCIVEALAQGRLPAGVPEGVRRTARVAPEGAAAAGRLASTVGANRGIQVYADGERVGPLPATIEVVPGALSVVVGPDARLRS